MVVTPENFVATVQFIESGNLRAITCPVFTGFPVAIDCSSGTVADLPLPFQGAIIKNLLGHLPRPGDYSHILEIPLSDLFLSARPH